MYACMFICIYVHTCVCTQCTSLPQIMVSLAACCQDFNVTLYYESDIEQLISSNISSQADVLFQQYSSFYSVQDTYMKIT